MVDKKVVNAAEEKEGSLEHMDFTFADNASEKKQRN